MHVGAHVRRRAHSNWDDPGLKSTSVQRLTKCICARTALSRARAEEPVRNNCMGKACVHSMLALQPLVARSAADTQRKRGTCGALDRSCSYTTRALAAAPEHQPTGVRSLASACASRTARHTRHLLSTQSESSKILQAVLASTQCNSKKAFLEWGSLLGQRCTHLSRLPDWRNGRQHGASPAHGLHQEARAVTQMHYGTHASWIQQIMSGEDAIPRSIKTSCQARIRDGTHCPAPA